MATTTEILIKAKDLTGPALASARSAQAQLRADLAATTKASIREAQAQAKAQIAAAKQMAAQVRAAAPAAGRSAATAQGKAMIDAAREAGRAQIQAARDAASQAQAQYQVVVAAAKDAAREQTAAARASSREQTAAARAASREQAAAARSSAAAQKQAARDVAAAARMASREQTAAARAASREQAAAARSAAQAQKQAMRDATAAARAAYREQAAAARAAARAQQDAARRQQQQKRDRSGQMGDAASLVGFAGPAAAAVGLVASLGKAASASDELNASMRTLEATAKITGTPLDYLLSLSDQAQGKFQMSAVQANAFSTEVAKLGAKAGDMSKAGDAMKSFLDLGAARGLSAEETLKAVQQSILGIDEGTDKLFNANPSVLYDQFAQSIGTTAEKLTDGQKAQALMNAALTDGGKVAGSYESSLDTAAGKQQLLSVATNKFWVEFGAAIEDARKYVYDVATTIAEFATTFVVAWQVGVNDLSGWLLKAGNNLELFWIGIKESVIDAINAIRETVGMSEMDGTKVAKTEIANARARIEKENADIDAGVAAANKKLLEGRVGGGEKTVDLKGLNAPRTGAGGAGGGGKGKGGGKKKEDADAWMKAIPGMKAATTQANKLEAALELSEITGKAPAKAAESIESLREQLKGLASGLDETKLGSETYEKAVKALTGEWNELESAAEKLRDKAFKPTEDAIEDLSDTGELARLRAEASGSETVIYPKGMEDSIETLRKRILATLAALEQAPRTDANRAELERYRKALADLNGQAEDFAENQRKIQQSGVESARRNFEAAQAQASLARSQMDFSTAPGGREAGLADMTARRDAIEKEISGLAQSAAAADQARVRQLTDTLGGINAILNQQQQLAGLTNAATAKLMGDFRGFLRDQKEAIEAEMAQLAGSKKPEDQERFAQLGGELDGVDASLREQQQKFGTAKESFDIQAQALADKGKSTSEIFAGSWITAIEAFTASTTEAFGLFLAGQISLGEAVKKIAQGTLAATAGALAQEFTIRAAGEIAMGISKGPLGGQHYAAAGKFMLAAAAASAVAASVSGGGKGGGGGATAASRAQERQADAAMTSKNARGTIIINGGLLDMNDWRQRRALADAMGVVEGGNWEVRGGTTSGGGYSSGSTGRGGGRAAAAR